MKFKSGCMLWSQHPPPTLPRPLSTADPLLSSCQLSAFVIFSFVLSGCCVLLVQTSAYANRKMQPGLKKAVVISIHHLSECLVSTSINTIEQKNVTGPVEKPFPSLSGEVYFQLFSLALAPVIYKTTEPSGVNYI